MRRSSSNSPARDGAAKRPPKARKGSRPRAGAVPTPPMAPTAPIARLSPLRRDLLLGALVGGSMLLITGLYVFSMRYQDIYKEAPTDFPRWSSLTKGVVERSEPLRSKLGEFKDVVTAVAGAGRTQAEATALLKKKLEARLNATSTPETSATSTETAPPDAPHPL